MQDRQNCTIGENHRIRSGRPAVPAFPLAIPILDQAIRLRPAPPTCHPGHRFDPFTIVSNQAFHKKTPFSNILRLEGVFYRF
jgi:hypothetical protein